MVITVDTGGTKTLVASFDSRGGIIKQHRFPTPKETIEYITTLADIINSQYKGSKGAQAICIAVPGVVKRNKAIFCPNLAWRNFDIANALRPKLNYPNPTIWLENDANLAGLAEAHALTKTSHTCLYITVSTGIGTGIIRGGHIDPGFRLSEGSHMVLEYDGILRHWESFASGRAIYETYGRYARDITSQDTWEQIADKISRGLLAIIPLLHPDTIVIGGSIGTYFTQYSTPLSKILEETLPHYIDQPVITQASHPEEAVIYGCYIFANQKLGHEKTS